MYAAVRFEHALQAACSLGSGTMCTYLVSEAVHSLESAKWRLCYGCWAGCNRKLADLCRWMTRTRRALAEMDRLQRHVGELLGDLEHNQDALVHYSAHRRRGEPLSTVFVESAVNGIIATRMNMRRQMRWSRATVQPFLNIHTAVLNDTLEDGFRQRYPGFGPATMINQLLPAAALSPSPTILNAFGELLPVRQNVSDVHKQLAVMGLFHVVTAAALVRYHAGSCATFRSWSMRSSRPGLGER